MSKITATFDTVNKTVSNIIMDPTDKNTYNISATFKSTGVSNVSIGIIPPPLPPPSSTNITFASTVDVVNNKLTNTSITNNTDDKNTYDISAMINLTTNKVSSATITKVTAPVPDPIPDPVSAITMSTTLNALSNSASGTTLTNTTTDKNTYDVVAVMDLTTNKVTSSKFTKVVAPTPDPTPDPIPDPIPNPTPGNSNVTISVQPTSTWNGGYGCNLVITNNNNYDIMAYSIEINSATTINWTNNLKVSKNNNITLLSQQAWTPKLLKNSTFIEDFGGSGNPPSSNECKFIQIDPPTTVVTYNDKFPARFASPYVDILLYPTISISTVAAKTGHKIFTLAFIVSQNNKASFGGVIPLENRFYMAEINKLREQNGSVIFSLGGANGIELAISIKDVNTLAAEYSRIIDMYQAKYLSFDIEGGHIRDSDANDRRNKAINILHQKYPDLKINYCLPTLTDGVTADGMALIKNIVQNKTKVEIFEIMSFDFGQSIYDINRDGPMYQAVIKSGNALYNQLKSVGYTNPKVGLIFMNGKTDMASHEWFLQEDAKQLLAWANQTPFVALLSYWSLTRDVKSTPKNYAEATSSSIQQEDYDFLNIIKAFK